MWSALITGCMSFAFSKIERQIESGRSCSRQGLKLAKQQAGSISLNEHEANSTGLHFLITSDWGGLPVWPWVTPGQLKVASALGRISRARGSKFILSLGDHFYFHGVQSADDPRWKRTFERVFVAPSLQGAGFWRIVAGNHDHNGNITAQLAYAARASSRWNYPALQHAWREVVHEDHNPVCSEEARAHPEHASNVAKGRCILMNKTTIGFLLIDTVMLCGPSSSRLKQLPREVMKKFGGAERHWKWIEAALEAMQDTDFIVVGGHYPIESPSAHGPCQCLRTRLSPLLARFSVSVYFSGHDHALFHIDPAALHPRSMRKRSRGGSHFRTALHGVGAGFTVSASIAHQGSCARGLRFHYRGDGHLRALSGGFADASVHKNMLKVSHYDAHGRKLYSHSIMPRATSHGARAAFALVV